jgi:hypothetical protein
MNDLQKRTFNNAPWLIMLEILADGDILVWDTELHIPYVLTTSGNVEGLQWHYGPYGTKAIG